MDFEETYKPRLDPVWSRSTMFPEMTRLPEGPPIKSKKHLNRMSLHNGHRIDSIGRPIVLPKMTDNIKRVLDTLRGVEHRLKLEGVIALFPDLHYSRVKSALKSLELRGEVIKSGTPRRGKDMTTGFEYKAVTKTENQINPPS